MLTHRSVILSEAKDPMHACGASGNARRSHDVEDFASKLLNELLNNVALIGKGTTLQSAEKARAT
jgi:hypothetical protein